MPTRPYVPRRHYRNNQSGHKGIYWREDARAYSVQRMVNGKQKTMGYRATLKEAIELYNEPITQQDSPGIIYTPLPPQDLTSGFRQTLAYLIANGQTAEASLVQTAIDRIEALKAAGANVK